MLPAVVAGASASGADGPDLVVGFLVMLALLVVFVAVWALLAKVVPQAQQEEFDKWVGAMRQVFFRWRGKPQVVATFEPTRCPPTGSRPSSGFPRKAPRARHPTGMAEDRMEADRSRVLPALVRRPRRLSGDRPARR